MTFSLLPLLLHEADVPASARAALREATRSSSRQRAAWLEAAAFALEHKTHHTNKNTQTHNNHNNKQQPNASGLSRHSLEMWTPLVRSARAAADFAAASVASRSAFVFWSCSSRAFAAARSLSLWAATTASTAFAT